MDSEEIRLRLSLDKKKEGGATHYILLKKMGMPFMNGGVPEGILRETLEEIKP
jgi:3-dehydroquinate synthetase